MAPGTRRLLSDPSPGNLSSSDGNSLIVSFLHAFFFLPCTSPCLFPIPLRAHGMVQRRLRRLVMPVAAGRGVAEGGRVGEWKASRIRLIRKRSKNKHKVLSFGASCVSSGVYMVDKASKTATFITYPGTLNGNSTSRVCYPVWR
jgi:hypothetical protein